MRTPQIGPDLRLAKTMWKNTTTEQKANEEKLKKKTGQMPKELRFNVFHLPK